MTTRGVERSEGEISARPTELNLFSFKSQETQRLTLANIEGQKFSHELDVASQAARQHKAETDSRGIRLKSLNDEKDELGRQSESFIDRKSVV